jgi:hypothetical protein
VTAVNTAAFAARTLRRWGTAANEVRIMPLPYSLVIHDAEDGDGELRENPSDQADRRRIEVSLAVGGQAVGPRDVRAADDRRQRDRGGAAANSVQ